MNVQTYYRINPHFSAHYMATKPETMSIQTLNEREQQLKTWFMENKKGNVAYISLPEETKDRFHIITSDNAKSPSIYQTLLAKIEELGLLVKVLPLSKLTSSKHAED